MIKNNKTIKESVIVDQVINFLNQDNLLMFCKEVQLFEKFIDVFFYNRNKNEYIAVEAKVNSTTRAFQQASKYKYIANYVYVATLRNGSNKKAYELSELTGIGLIFIDILENQYFVEIAVHPQSSDIYVDELANKVWNMAVN